MRILVLGGYGAMGQIISEDLVRSGATVVVAGRDVDRARRWADRLGSRAEPARMDATDRDLAGKINRAEPDVLVNATWYEFNVPVMTSAIRAGVHYVDLGGLYHKTLEQLKFHRSALDGNLLCLLGMGSTPGTTNILAAYGAARLDTIEKVEIRSGWRVLERTPRPILPFSVRTIIDEFTLPAPVLRNGKLHLIQPRSSKVKFTFPKPLGVLVGHYSIHSELATLPSNLDKGVREMDFAVAYPRDLTELVDSTISTHSDRDVQVEELQKATMVPEKDPRDIDGQRVDMWGTRAGKKMFLRYDSITTYNSRLGHGTNMDTGVPASIAAQWIASGLLKARGVLPPELVFRDLEERYFKELGARGSMRIWEQVNRGPRRALH